MSPSATSPAKTRLAEALKSVAITGAPLNIGMPSITAVLPLRVILPPIRAISCTCINLFSKTVSVTVEFPSAMALRETN